MNQQQQPGQPSTVLEDLPNEMLVAVLRELNLPDLINCRSVAKRFRALVDSHLKIRELFLFSYGDLFSFPDLSIVPSFRYLLQRSDSSILRSPSFKGFLSISLRSLAVCAPIENPHLLNQFSSLERLYLKTIVIGPRARLTLPLKVLFIRSIEIKLGVLKGATLVVDSKILEKLQCGALHRIKLTHYDAVKQVTILSVPVVHPDLSTFKKLRTLKWMQFDRDVDQSEGAILALEDLTELHFQWDKLITQETKARVDQLVKQIWTLKPALRIFWIGIELTEENSTSLIRRHFTHLEEVLKMQIENYRQLSASSLEHYSTFSYQLPAFENQGLPDDFFRKFCFRYVGGVRPIGSPDRFVWLVNSCKDLILLKFNISGLERSFLDRLSLNRLSLHFLYLVGQNPEFDFGPILRLGYLWVLKIEQELDCEAVLSFFECCKSLRKLCFVFESTKFIGSRTPNNRYLLANESDGRRWFVVGACEWAELCKCILGKETVTRSRAKRMKTNLID